MKDNMMPNFFILGAAKSGTTTLYSLLSTHSDIYFPIVKEPNFFSNDKYYKKGLEYYKNRFFGEDAKEYILRGEATTNYICFEKVAKRIKDVYINSNPKFIIILRNPIERAYSLYWHSVRDNRENLSFKEAIDKEEERIKNSNYRSQGKIYYSYLSSGLYAKQIKAYLNYFDKENFLFLFTEDLKEDSKKVLKKVSYFLNVQFDFEIKKDKRNSASMPRFRWVLNFQKKSIKLLQNMIPMSIKKLLPRDLFYRLNRKLYKLNMKEVDYPPMSSEIKNKLKDYFRNDILDLQRITNKDLSHWLEI